MSEEKPVHIDRERMDRALAGERYSIPSGLTYEQIEAFLTNVARAATEGARAERARCAEACRTVAARYADYMGDEWPDPAWVIDQCEELIQSGPSAA